ncbi:hypothetical protein COHA_010424 [Chlorella ohadii]|uniref:Uncharacterized protein n=1 Tax=Chlorella ohadii TaxID=2649997 RepID=A0AAD5H0J8_9CHLO|nr:hypothetical protein COHA_010424 [Chlorella ohadii]
MDDIVNELESLYTEQEQAVAREDYRAAAALKAQREALEAGDAVGEAMDRLDAAIAEERFEDAARLRDQAAVSAVGWWVGRGNGDPCGHLLRITPDFSRYVGQVYSPRDLTELMPDKLGGEGDDMRSRMLAALQQKQRELAGGAFNPDEEEEQEELTPDEVGLPVLELFIRRDGDGYEHQAVALFAPAQPEDEEEEEAELLAPQAVANGIAEMIATDAGDGNVVSVERGQKEDGSSFVTIEISSLADEGLTQEEAELQARLSGGLDSDDEDDAAGPAEDTDDDEDIRTIDDLAASVGVRPDDDVSSSASSSSSSSSSSAAASAGAAEVGEEEAEKLARWQDMAAKLGSMGEEIAETVEAIEQALLQGVGGSGNDSTDIQALAWQEGPTGFGETIDEALSQVQSPSDMGTFLQRAPAKISWHGRDCFTVSVSEPPQLRAARQAQQATAAAAAVDEPPTLQRPPVRIIYDGKEQQRGRQPQGGPDASSSSSNSSQRGQDGSMDVEVTAEESDSEEVSVLLSPTAQQAQQAQRTQQAQQQQQQDVAQPPASTEQRLQSEQEAIAADSAALAEQIESLQGDMLAGRKPSQEKINEIAKRAMGLALAQGMSSAAQGDVAERWGLEGQTTYQRVRLGSFVKTDPFNGLYLGTFGPHGPELLQVARQMEGVQEYVVATKLTGDPNVPAGAVSWKAAIGRGSRLPVEMYPLEMGVMGRYRGQGQVAQSGYSNPRWVDGELLVFAAGSPFVQGAQLGFTYDVGTHQRYLIVLHRVNLDEMFPEDA